MIAPGLVNEEPVSFGSDFRRRARLRRPRSPWLCLSLLVAFSARPASAQSVQSRLENDFGDLLRYLSQLVTYVGNASRGQVLSFLNKVELFNVENEIDRLVGNPWQLSDSTSYKLSLAPMHLAYPVFDQQLQQMTRLDDIRTRRIQDLTVDSLGLITVNLDILNSGPTGGQLASSVLHYLNAREFLDLGVFLLGQQPFFPQNDEEWATWKHRLAAHQGVLALTVAGLGALVEAGAVSNSGVLSRCRADACRLGWYGSISRLGYHLQPTLRGGLSARLPWLELSAGLLDRVRAPTDGASTVFELALRESWLDHHTSASGWNSFVEAAVRRVLAAESGYQGDRFTARSGVFVKRERPFRWRHIVVRGSTEIESDLTGSLRYAVGLGVDYTRTGLTTVLQSSRTTIPKETGLTPETRTGLFVAGTVESPVQYYVEAMQVGARLLREGWREYGESQAELRLAEAEMRVLASGNVPAYRMAALLETVRRASAESEARRVGLATLLCDYLQARRTAYSLKQWKRGADGHYGPVDSEVLDAAADAVLQRLRELAAFLQAEQGPLQDLRDRYVATHDRLDRLRPGDHAQRARILGALAEIDQASRQASEAVSQGLRLYHHYLGALRRIASLSAGLMPAGRFDLLGPRTVRRLLTLVAQPMQ
jgi:hypothetical protein